MRGEVRKGGATVGHGEDHISMDVHTADHGCSHTKAGGYFLKKLWIKEKTCAWAGEKHQEEGEMLSADHNTLFFITPVLLKLRVGREVRSEGLKLSWKKKGWTGENV